ncbi:MAG: glycosyltransferase family 2 protein [bacterium]|nr:glycosyltransferase family 2 protein [bacterium]
MKTLVSVVVPFFNEEENVPLLAERVGAVFSELVDYDFEGVFVNDGSTDGTRAQLEALKAEDTRIRPVHLARNSGQSAAIIAGMRRARGTYILMLDGDLQNDPSDFPRMLELLQDFDCVCGYRAKRKDSRVKQMASRIANGIRRRWLDDDIIDAGCGSKGFRRECVEHVISFNGMHRYFGVMMKAAGMRIVDMEVTHHPRQHGASKYGVLDRAWRGAYDLIGVAWLRNRYVPIRVEEDE